MKKRILIIVSAICVLVLGIIVWYNSPIDFVDLNPEDVLEIVIFDGNTGNALHIKEEEEIECLIENLNSVRLRRDKISVGYSGYRFKTTIYLTDGEEANGWNNFIINSNDTVRKDPFFYRVIEGSIDYQYIQSLFDKGK